MPAIVLSYQLTDSSGVFSRSTDVPIGVWIRVRNAAASVDSSAEIGDWRIRVDWRAALDLLRLLAPLQASLGFEFDTDATSTEAVQRFMEEVASVRRSAATLDDSEWDSTTVGVRLRELGWNIAGHALTDYQIENVVRLMRMRNGANFSVPGAGKTTVSFALHLLTRNSIDLLLVVAPRNAFQAWEEVSAECLGPEARSELLEPFTVLSGGEARISEELGGGARRFLISYDQLVRVESVIHHLLSTRATHLVLDESHRMKAGTLSRRGAVLLRLGHLAARRDILSGTPMPQRSLDLQSQLDFLWPGAGLGSRVQVGEAPRSVLGSLYVRTTKQQLGLEPRRRIGVPVTLTQAHLAFYSVIKEDVRARASALRRGQSAVELIRARRSVIRLLQAAVNPELVVRSLQEDAPEGADGLLRAVLAEGPSARIRAAADIVIRLVSEGKKVLVWTIFTSTLHQLTRLLTHLQPAVIFGEVGVGDDSDDDTRQGQVRRFKTDPNCMVMIANPAAASEGMSLHLQCHDAVYVDRSYNATHFLQSIDRIHRLGLPPGTQTTVYVLENRLPIGVGSIDLSVARRLARKIRAMEELLRDPDLHELALDEEAMTGALEESIDAQDIDDLVAELESRHGPTNEDEIV